MTCLNVIVDEHYSPGAGPGSSVLAAAPLRAASRSLHSCALSWLIPPTSLLIPSHFFVPSVCFFRLQLPTLYSLGPPHSPPPLPFPLPLPLSHPMFPAPSQGLPGSVRTGGRPSREEALQAVAVINRIRRLLGSISGAAGSRPAGGLENAADTNSSRNIRPRDGLLRASSPNPHHVFPLLPSFIYPPLPPALLPSTCLQFPLLPALILPLSHPPSPNRRSPQPSQMALLSASGRLPPPWGVQPTATPGLLRSLRRRWCG